MNKVESYIIQLNRNLAEKPSSLGTFYFRPDKSFDLSSMANVQTLLKEKFYGYSMNVINFGD